MPQMARELGVGCGVPPSRANAVGQSLERLTTPSFNHNERPCASGWRGVSVTKISFVGLLVVVLAGVAGPAQGQGWYLGSALGAHVVPDLGMTGLSNDRASVCDAPSIRSMRR